MTESTFTGFPADALRFFQDLKDNNSRDWFNSHKRRYQENVIKPAVSFIEALGNHLKQLHPNIHFDMQTTGKGSIFRINRDIRFSPDKSPYKTHLGILFWIEGRKMESPGYYFHLEEKGAGLYAGAHQFTPATLTMYRNTAAEKKPGKELADILTTISSTHNFSVGGDQLKRVPQPFPQDHPHGDLLKYKGLYAKSPEIPPETVTSESLVDICLKYATTMSPLIHWLSRHTS